MKIKNLFSILLILFAALILPTAAVHAACGGTVRTWDADANTNRWDTAANWSADDRPDTTSEDAVIVSASKIPKTRLTASIGCLEIQSGQLKSNNNRTLTVTGDYFRNLTVNSFVWVATHTATWIVMGGSSNQTFENVDPMRNIRITNNNTVEFTHAFNIITQLDLAGSTTNLEIQADLTLDAASTTLTIPAGNTVTVTNGATLTANEGIIVNGTLIVDPGAQVVIGNGKTLQVNSGGQVELSGSSGNVAMITSTGGGDTFTFNMAGTLIADYFRIDRMDTTGVNITGTLQSIGNGEFHFIANSGAAMTFGSGISVPSTADNIGFYNDDAHGTVYNIDASSYSGSAITVENWSGSAADAANENDPNTVINWGTQAGTKISVSDNTASGNPPDTIGQSSADTLFATFAFSLNQASTETNVTEVIITMGGTASTGDIAAVKVYKDVGGGTNCVYDSGVDTQIGSNLSLSGSPLSATLTIPSGDVATNSDSDLSCIHVLASTSGSAQDSKSISFSIDSTADVTNSESYSFSGGASPPVSAGSTDISTGVVINRWQGDTSSDWDRNTNWQKTGYPNATKDCVIGAGTNVTQVNIAAAACLNATFQSGGTIDFMNSTNEIAVYGSLDVESSYTFSNATTGNLAMRGADNQGLSIATAFPGNFTIANTGSPGSNVVSLSSNSEVQGNVTVTSGVLRIATGAAFTVLGNLTVSTGATLDIEPGGTLKLADGKSLTINSGGTLELLGSVSQTANISSNSGASAMSVTVNGSIKAKYYSIDHLDTNGVSIESGASIDASYYMQNGTFSYPVNSSSTLLNLKTQIPGNTLSDMTFSSAGSAAATIKNINTTGASSGTLTVSNYSGDLAGLSYDTDPTYVIAWSGATNTIDLTQELTGPSGVTAGETYNMGTFGFQQTLAGASYSDADITSLKLTLTGTAYSSDVSAGRIYYDSDCNGTGGTLLASRSFSGSPAIATFAMPPSTATVQASTTSTPKRCIYVELDIASGASAGRTVGVKINSSSDVVTDVTYQINSGTPPPINLGSTATIAAALASTWTGATDSDWTDASNWSGGVPDSTKNCTIVNAGTAPVINGTATCKDATISGGSLTLQNSTSSTLEVYGDFINSATFNSNDGKLKFIDAAGATQILDSNSSINEVTFAKTGSGVLRVDKSLTITTLTFPASQSFQWRVPSGVVLTLSNGVSVPAGVTYNLQGGGTTKIAANKTISVTGGTFVVSGTNDTYPQTLSNKGKITISGSGRWAFSATSGTVSLTGFLLEYLDTNGLNIGGSANLSALNGGQFVRLSTSYASMKAVQISTSGTVTPTANNIGWMWGDANDDASTGCCGPGTSETYTLVYSSGCSGQSISFDQWFGDFHQGNETPDTSTKVTASSCNVAIAASASPVTLTQFKATGYDDAILIDWQTGSELDHQGFNIYRSQNAYLGFVQMNSELIRNIISSGSLHGKYRYVDNDVDNNTTYYYMIEDVAINGNKIQHGPVYATAASGLGSVPAADSDVNEGDSSTGGDSGNTPTQGPIVNPGLVDLGHGVHVLSQALGSIRIEIIPPASTYTTSTWNASYETVTMPGYSASLTSGHPQLLERTVLIEVKQNAQSVAASELTLTEKALENHKISPAPSYTPDAGGVLIANWSPDASAYAVSALAPSSYYSVEPAVQTIGGRYYIKIHITPLKYNASTEQVASLEKLVLDIDLDGQGWAPTAPANELADNPSAVEGVLRIRYNQSGMYELSYDDLYSSYVEGPFDGIHIDGLRLYFRGMEIPVQVLSADANFNSGDKIRFWANTYKNIEDASNELVLSSVSLGDSNGAALRFQSFDAQPGALPLSPQQSTFSRVVAEQNNMSIFDRPLGFFEDHYYWGRMATEYGSSPISSQLTIPVDLDGLDPTSSGNVRIKVKVSGKGAFAQNPEHHLGLYINTVPFILADASFTQLGVNTLTLEVPASYFISGTNHLIFRALADKVPSGDWDIIDLDNVIVEYPKYLEAYNNQLIVELPYLNKVTSIPGFSSSNISVFDVSDQLFTTQLDNVEVQLDASGVTYEVNFAASIDSNDELGFRLIAIEDSAYLKPISLSLSTGFDAPLKSVNNTADFIIIGPSNLLNAASELIEKRQDEGMRVRTASLDQIYAEFSHGEVSSHGIKDFLSFAFNQWNQPAPKYVLIIGDATYDPLNNDGNNHAVMSTPLLKGQYTDFGSDNWYVTDAGSNIPKMAIGRIPFNSPAKVENYINKVISYESGQLQPNKPKSIHYVADKSNYNEGFSKQTQSLSNELTQMYSTTSNSLTNKADYANATDFKAAVKDNFTQAPLIMTYLGHGAEDQWTDFELADVKTLDNSGLPITVSLNCLNTLHYDADPDRISLGESFIELEDSGAVAFWGSTTLTHPNAQIQLYRSFQTNLSQELQGNVKTLRLGELTLTAKSSIADSPSSEDTLNSFTLLGDPTLRIPASAFTPPVSQPQSSDDGGGSGGCGTINANLPPPSSGSQSLILLLFMLPLMLGYSVRKKLV